MTLDVPAETGTHRIDGFEVTVERNLVKQLKRSNIFGSANTIRNGDEEDVVEVVYGYMNGSELNDVADSDDWKFKKATTESDSVVLKVRYVGN